MEQAAWEHLEAELRRARLLLAFHCQRLGREGAEPDGAGAPPILAALEHAAATSASLEQRAQQAGVRLPLAFLRERFALSDDEYLVLLLCLAAEFDPGALPLFRLLQNDAERGYPTLALVAETLVPAERALRVRQVLDPDYPLVFWGLVEIDRSRRSRPLLHQPLLAAPRIVPYVEGKLSLPASLRPLCRLHETAGARDDFLLTAADYPAWQGLVHHAASCAGRPGDLPIVVLRGPEGSGRHRWALELAALLGQRVLGCDAPALATAFDDLTEGFRTLRREAELQEAVLCIAAVDELEAGMGPVGEPASERPGRPGHSPAARALAQAVATHPGAVVLLAAAHADVPPTSRETVVIDLSPPAEDTARRLWERSLPRPNRASDFDAGVLAQRFRLTPGQIQAACAAALRSGERQGQPCPLVDMAGLHREVKGQLRHRLGDVATLLEPHQTWADLVVPDDVRFQLREIVSRHRHRSTVLQGWGLARLVGTAQGMAALFDGPPGTGKSMAAGIIARELELDLYQVDLSRVVSRYVGETEKNLSRVFDEVERANAMLLFDEADSLFSARTRVQSANDRYANLEVNYLLQRIERFDGVAILTTNFADGLDEAFRRRLSLRVTFPKPDVQDRARLWAAMLRAETLPRGEIDCDALAATFDLAGGHIRNAVLRAAYVAAARGSCVDQALLAAAARIELRAQGLLVQGDPVAELRGAAAAGPTGGAAG